MRLTERHEHVKVWAELVDAAPSGVGDEQPAHALRWVLVTRHLVLAADQLEYNKPK